MIKLRIKNKNGDILYERDDDYYVRLNSEDYAYISDALDDVGSDTIYVDIDCDADDNPFMVYSHHSVMRGGKTVIENKIRKILKEYDKQLSALPAWHPAEHKASRMREVGGHDEDDGRDKDDDHDEDDGHDENDGHDNYDDYDGHDGHDNYDDYDSHDDHDDYDDRIFSLSGMGLPDHRFEEELRKDILATLPGSYVGCGKHESCRREDGRGRQGRKGNKRCNLEDFVAYLHTYGSWAALLDDLQFHSESPTEEGTARLMQKYHEWRDGQIRK